jgi:hypothetical protein
LDIIFEKVHSHRKPGPKLESSRTTEERKAKDDLEKNSGRGSWKSRQNMEGSHRTSSEQSALALLC